MNDDYDFSQVIPLTHRKTKGIIQDKNFYVTGFVLTQEDGDKCIVDMSAVRWLSMSEFHDLMHPPVDAPKMKDEPVAWYKKSLRELIESMPRRIEPLGGQRTSYVQLAEVIGWIEEYEKLHPPTKTAPKKPMTEEQIDEELETNEYYCAKSFAEGVRFAERHHGIGGGDE